MILSRIFLIIHILILSSFAENCKNVTYESILGEFASAYISFTEIKMERETNIGMTTALDKSTCLKLEKRIKLVTFVYLHSKLDGELGGHIHKAVKDLNQYELLKKYATELEKKSNNHNKKNIKMFKDYIDYVKYGIPNHIRLKKKSK